jgi:hypothetical protein
MRGSDERSNRFSRLNQLLVTLKGSMESLFMTGLSRFSFIAGESETSFAKAIPCIQRSCTGYRQMKLYKS